MPQGAYRRLQMTYRILYTVMMTAWVCVATLVFGLLAIGTSFVTRSGNLPHRVGRAWAQSIMRVGRMRVHVKGLANIEAHRSYIYMANHTSNFDIPVLLGYLPVQFRWLAKAELFRIPIFGYAMHRCGYISIDRFNHAAAVKSLSTAARRIREGVSVLIFPEGTRSWDGQVGPFKKGGFVVAVDAGVPIVPVFIRGTRTIMPKGKRLITPGSVTMEIFSPVPTIDFTRQNKQILMDKVRTRIIEAYRQQEGSGA